MIPPFLQESGVEIKFENEKGAMVVLQEDNYQLQWNYHLTENNNKTQQSLR